MPSRTLAFAILATFLTVFDSAALANDSNGSSSSSYSVMAQGSTPSHRAQVDTSPGQVYVYVGGSFRTGRLPAAFQYLFDFTEAGNSTGYITPLLFERVPGEVFTTYVLRGIGKGSQVSLNPLPRTIPFEILNGMRVPANANFTFGYVNALVDANGNQLASSPGTVDMDNPADTGEGTGGAGTTNDWAVTNYSPYPVVSLGATFGASGTEYPFYLPLRTYSAQVFSFLIN